MTPEIRAFECALALYGWRACWLQHVGLVLLFAIMLLHHASAQIN